MKWLKVMWLPQSTVHSAHSWLFWIIHTVQVWWPFTRYVLWRVMCKCEVHNTVLKCAFCPKSTHSSYDEWHGINSTSSRDHKVKYWLQYIYGKFLSKGKISKTMLYMVKFWYTRIYKCVLQWWTVLEVMCSVVCKKCLWMCARMTMIEFLN